MRWRSPVFGDVRVRAGFLVFPRCIGGEWRWLEYARWLQRYDRSCGWHSWRWVKGDDVSLDEKVDSILKNWE